MIVEIPGKPQPKQRPRLGRRNGKETVYTPEPTKAFESLVAQHARRAGAIPSGEPSDVEIISIFPLTKTWSKKKKMEMDGQRHTQKPDSDNLAKCVIDGLNGTLFSDDSRVYGFSHRKFWSSDCGEGKTIIRTGADRSPAHAALMVSTLEDALGERWPG